MSDNVPSVILRGREFSASDLSIIKSCVSENYHLGRTRISQTVCEMLNWRQPNGWLKDRACRDVLRILEGRGIVELPPSLVKRAKSDKTNKNVALGNRILKEYDFDTQVEEFPSHIQLVFAKGNKYEQIWNILVEKYHYLGHQVVVGRTIKYLIMADNKFLGAICFSSASWHLSQRDTLLANLGIMQPRDYVINNSRFLILPNVKVKNLASCILSLATRQVSVDWSWYYSLTPLIAETFVQPSLYGGICYRAANWVEIGTTKGFAKRGSSFRNSQEPKRIFIYGLNKDIRRQLDKVIAERKNANP